MEKVRILLGLGVLEAAHGGTAKLVAVRPDTLEEVEKRLFLDARKMVARLPFDDLDVLVVDELGKDISGTGMDPHVIGRLDVLRQPRPDSPRILRIVVRDLTDTTGGNASGIGFADYVTSRLMERMDRHVTYVNCMASMTPEEARIPIVAETDRQAIEWALTTCGALCPNEARLARIKNTSRLEQLYISSALLPEIRGREDLEVRGSLEPMVFDGGGTLAGGW
jgi:hypothetical protein